MKLFDLHAHPSLKAYGNRVNDGKFDIWKTRKHKLPHLPAIDEIFEGGLLGIFSSPISGLIRRFLLTTGGQMAALFSQSNLRSAFEGNVKLIGLSIYPVEREFYTRGNKKDGGNQDKLQSWISGQHEDYIEDVQQGNFSYWDQYKHEIDLLVKGQDEIYGVNKWKYRIICSYDDYKAIDQDDQTVGIIISAEGIQSLASNVAGQQSNFFALKKAAKHNSQAFKNWRSDLMNNLRFIKEDPTIKPYSPLYITVSHHFFNYIAGQCKSLMDINLGPLGSLIFKQRGFYTENGQKRSYFKWGFVGDFGKSIIREMLRRDPANNVRRILIDIKHFSPKTRTEFYEMMKTEYAGETIPLVCSHTSCNGIANLRTTLSKQMKEKSDFQVMELNTYDEDIIEIYKSGGIMGLMMDDGRICSKAISKIIKRYNRERFKAINKAVKLKERLTKIKRKKRKKAIRKKIKKNHELERGFFFLLNEIYCRNFFRQVFHVVGVLQQQNIVAGEKAWDILCIGSDYDGAINPMDLYGTYSKLEVFTEELIDHWEDQLEEKDPDDPLDYKAYLFGKKPSFWIEKVFWSNSQLFLKKYFHDDYLVHGKVMNEQTHNTQVIT